MEQMEGKRSTCRMEITVRGSKVTLHFTDEPNPDVSSTGQAGTAEYLPADIEAAANS